MKLLAPDYMVSAKMNLTLVLLLGSERVPAYSHNRPELDYFLVYSNRLDYFNNRMVFDIENIDI